MTGIAPSLLTESSTSMLEEMWNSYTEHEVNFWSWERELLATAVELLHALYRQQSAIWGSKGNALPPPLHITRPHEEKAKDKSGAVTPAELARIMRSG